MSSDTPVLMTLKVCEGGEDEGYAPYAVTLEFGDSTRYMVADTLQSVFDMAANALMERAIERS